MYGVLIFAFFRNVKVLQLLFKPYFKIRTQLQFTVSGGRHSVLERPLSDENSRPFLVKTLAIIGY